MRSKASFKGHPIHPILICFPIAFFVGTFLLDLLQIITGKENLDQTAVYLETAGIISALLAAVPGIIDYFFVVPSQSSAKKRATKHGLLNISMVIIFTTALVLRQTENHSLFIILGLESIGITFLFIAGWMGGTLVYRNQIGVDHRYAHAGKWKEEKIKASADLIELKNMDELKMDQMKLLHVGGRRIVIARTETGYAGFDDHCTHRGGSLADGVLICGTVQCPWHGSQFDVNYGTIKAGPASDKINTYKIISKDQKFFLKLE